MPVKKKLNVGPLPEQREDYSHYQEDEIRWDRILLVGVLLLFVLGGLISLFAQDSEDGDKHLAPEQEMLTSTEAKKTIPVSSTAVSSPQMDEPAKPTIADTEPVAVQKSDQQIIQKELVAKPKNTNSLAKELAVSSGSNNVNDIVNDIAPEKFNLRPASVLITNSAIKAAVLNLSTDKGLPGELIKHSILMPEKGLIKVMLNTEMHGMKGKKLFHEWYRNGERVARVKIPVNVDKQQSYSSKFIDKYMTGEWQVKVIDASGEPYILADFDVINGQ